MDVRLRGRAQHVTERDALIFLIDCRKSMFEATSDGKIPFHVMLQCAATFISSKIITSENDLVGVCFFGSAQKKNANDFDNVYVVSPLDRPSAQLIVSLETMIS